MAARKRSPLSLSGQHQFTQKVIIGIRSPFALGAFFRAGYRRIRSGIFRFGAVLFSSIRELSCPIAPAFSYLPLRIRRSAGRWICMRLDDISKTFHLPLYCATSSAAASMAASNMARLSGSPDITLIADFIALWDDADGMRSCFSRFTVFGTSSSRISGSSDASYSGYGTSLPSSGKAPGTSHCFLSGEPRLAGVQYIPGSPCLYLWRRWYLHALADGAFIVLHQSLQFAHLPFEDADLLRIFTRLSCPS